MKKKRTVLPVFVLGLGLVLALGLALAAGELPGSTWEKEQPVDTAGQTGQT